MRVVSLPDDRRKAIARDPGDVCPLPGEMNRSEDDRSAHSTTFTRRHHPPVMTGTGVQLGPATRISKRS